VPPLAGLLLFNPPAAFHAWVDSQAHLKLSRDALYFLWNGLSPETRAGYGSAVKSYEFFCSQTGLRPWPATVQSLAEWVTGRATGRPLMQYQAKVKPETIASMLSALRSVHVDRQYSLTPFESPWLKRLLDGIRRCQPDAEVHKAEPISRQTLVKLAETDTGSIADLNFITACKVAWAGFLRCGEFTYSAKDYPGSRNFVNTKLTRSDVTFDEAFGYAIIRLKRSKTDYDHKGVEIVLAASRDQVCPVSALRDLFRRDTQPPSAPLFRSGAESPFDRSYLVDTLRRRLRIVRDPRADRYSGHSFRRGAAQHAADNGILDEDIQRLGRWSSDAFKLYFNTSLGHRFSLSKRFLTGMAPSFHSDNGSPGSTL
jgi:hypothetical protein